MIAKVLDGRQEARTLLRDLRQKVLRRKKPITLASILIGHRFDSELYVSLKMAAAKKVGIKTAHWALPQSISAVQLATIVDTLNKNPEINGILLQLPLPASLPTDAIVSRISPTKDADGFRTNSRTVLPPTIAAVMHLIAAAKPKRHSRAVILSRDSVFSRRLQTAMRAKGFKVTILTKPHGWKPVTHQADIIVTARGHGRRLTAPHVRPGTIVIDVGIRKHLGKTIGDVHPNVWQVAGAVSPVPGGVGPLTVAYLLYNTYHLALKKKK
jgi:methylenetetrahydrofolate dehydrogenase (NADP+)/methenyltetrahydrofolate cyclohydrolase